MQHSAKRLDRARGIRPLGLIAAGLLAWGLFTSPVRCAPPTKLASPADRREFSEVHMGVDFKLVFYVADPQAANRAAAAAFARIAQLDAAMSDYRADSELSRLSDSAGSGTSMVLSDDLWTILDRAQEFSRRSRGAFDVTCGQIVRQWRRARRQKQLPSPEQLEAARQTVGYQHLVLTAAAHSARLERAGTRLDLGGIAQGFAADAALGVLAEHGIRQALVDASGDVALGDPPPEQAHWRIAIPSPRGDDAPPAAYLGLARCAVSTSGDVYQHVVLGGQRYSHLVDPRTGRALTASPQVTVVASDGTTADALATATSVLGWQAGSALAAEYAGTELFWIEPEGDGLRTRQTEGLACWILPTPEP